jgi:hypothetical protein
MAERPALVRNLLIAGVALTGVVVLARAARRDPASACPREFPPTRIAATLLWDGRSHAWPPPGSALTPEDLTLLVDPADSELCARLADLLPDTLAVGGVAAPFFTAYYRAGDSYVVPIVPRVGAAEIEAEARGETILWKEGVTLVFDARFQPVFHVPN